MTATDPRPGLTGEEARRRLARGRPNALPSPEHRAGYRIAASQVASPLVVILLAAALVSRLLGEHVESLVILVIVALNALLGFAQEFRAERALRSLRGRVSRMARPWRDGQVVELPADQLVPGDVVELEVGDVVPADVRVLSGDLDTDDSLLTGESEPKEKAPGTTAWMATPVVRGAGRAEVVGTGLDTAIGRTARLLRGAPVTTDFQRNLRRLSAFLVRLVAALTIFVFLANALLHRGAFESLLFALALAVGLTPEVLPAIVTIALSRGALRMAREQVIVKRLASVEDLGNIDTLCCDKTGTLTRGVFSLDHYRSVDGGPDDRVLLDAALAGSADLGTPGRPAPNPTDRALWESEAISRVGPALAGCRIAARRPLDIGRRWTAIEVVEGEARRQIVKGAPESIVALCAPGATGAMDPVAFLAEVATREQEGLRIIALASRELAPGSEAPAFEQPGYRLRGYLAYLDPPKPDARASLQQLARLGVTLKVISGDSTTVTRRICQEVQLEIPGDRMLTGDEVATLDDAALARAVADCAVFTRMTPELKHRLVAALRSSGHVVGFLGDGINDAPALRVADVGIAVDSGADVAKDAADIILLQKSLRAVAGGIIEGRKTFANITKYILNTISANIGNMLTVAFSSLFLPFIPLLPSQILLNNLLSDLPLTAIATDRVDLEWLRRPRRWNWQRLGRAMFRFALLSVAFDLALIIPLLTLWRVDAASFRTAWFVESALSELLVTFALRTRQPLFRSHPSRFLAWGTLPVVLLAAGLPFTRPGQHYFAFVPLPGMLAGFLALLLACYVAAAEWMKRPVLGAVLPPAPHP